MGDEEERIAFAFVSQSREVEGRDPGLARDGGGNDEIAAMPVPAFRFEGFERYGMMRLRCDIDQQVLRSELVRRVAKEGYKMGDIFPELGTGAVGGQQRRKTPVKFRNPQNPEETWTGIGHSRSGCRRFSKSEGSTWRRSRRFPCTKFMRRVTESGDELQPATPPKSTVGSRDGGLGCLVSPSEDPTHPLRH